MRSRPPAPSASLQGAPDAVLVLGAAMAAPGVPGPALRRRIEHGVSVFFERAAGHIIVSGGVVGPPPAEAHVMRALAMALGVADERIVVEDSSRNTFENAVYAGRIIRERDWQRVVLVTDAFHLRRATFIFGRLGLAVEGCGVPRAPDVPAAAQLRAHVAEHLGLARSALLFALGAHKPLVDRVWGEHAR